MKNLLFLSLIVFLASCATSPCGPGKKQFLNNFNSFVEDVEEEELKYSSNKWEDHDLKFRKFVKECYPEFEDDLTRKEERKFASNSMKYYYIKYGKGFSKQYDEDGEEMIEKFSTNLDEFLEDNEEELEEFIHKIEESIDTEKVEEAIKDMVESLEESIDMDKVNETIKEFTEWLEGIDVNVEITQDKN